MTNTFQVIYKKTETISMKGYSRNPSWEYLNFVFELIYWWFIDGNVSSTDYGSQNGIVGEYSTRNNL